jgi:hypothetical protein
MHGSINGLGSGVDGVVDVAHGDVQRTGHSLKADPERGH